MINNLVKQQLVDLEPRIVVNPKRSNDLQEKVSCDFAIPMKSLKNIFSSKITPNALGSPGCVQRRPHGPLPLPPNVRERRC